MRGFSTLQGRAPTDLANMISDAINDAIQLGMETDEAVCVVLHVAADYARGTYGKDYLKDLAKIIVMRGDEPMPAQI